MMFSIIKSRKLYSPVTKVLKQLIQLPSTAKVNILTHPGIVGIIMLEQNQLTHHFTEFVIRINEDTVAGRLSLLRLRQFQLKYKLTQEIWIQDYNTFSKLSYTDNLNV